MFFSIVPLICFITHKIPRWSNRLEEIKSLETKKKEVKTNDKEMIQISSYYKPLLFVIQTYHFFLNNFEDIT